MHESMISRLVPLLVLALLILSPVSGGFGSEPAPTGSDGGPITAPGPRVASLRIGLAKIDITPDIESDQVPLAGYYDRHGNPATSIHDPLYARAMVAVDQQGAMAGIVSADLCYVHSEVRDRVIARLRPYGFTEDNLMIAATHNHSGFGGFDTRWIAKALFGGYNPRLQDLAVFGISSAVMQAKENLQPATMEIASNEMPIGANRSRRDPAFSVDEGGTASGDRTMDPEKYKTDRKLTVVRFTNGEGEPIGGLFNYASHPTVLSPKSFAVSADWPGVACAEVEETMGGDSVVLFLNGSLGDAAPRPDWDTVEKEWKSIDQYGHEIAEGVLGLMDSLKQVQGDAIRSKTVRKDFSRVILRSLGRIKLTKYSSRIAYKRPDQPLQAIQLGAIVFLGVPGEPTTLVGNELKKRCPDNATCLVVAPANGYLGYFVVSEEWKEGGYAADSCMFGLPGTQNVIEGVSEAVAGIR